MNALLYHLHHCGNVEIIDHRQCHYYTYQRRMERFRLLTSVIFGFKNKEINQQKKPHLDWRMCKKRGEHDEPKQLNDEP